MKFKDLIVIGIIYFLLINKNKIKYGEGIHDTGAGGTPWDLGKRDLERMTIGKSPDYSYDEDLFVPGGGKTPRGF